jgi:hypothetical protein
LADQVSVTRVVTRPSDGENGRVPPDLAHVQVLPVSLQVPPWAVEAIEAAHVTPMHLEDQQSSGLFLRVVVRRANAESTPEHDPGGD